MKIALVRKEFLPGGGGAEQYAVGLAGALVELGHEVHVFANRYSRLPGVVFHFVPVLRQISFLKNWSFATQFKRTIRGMGFDIVNGLSQIYPQDVYRLGDGIHRHWLKVKGGSPLSRLYNRVSPRHRTMLAIENRIFRPGNYLRIIANSRLCRDHALQYYGVPLERSEVVYNGIDFHRFNPSVRARREAVRTFLGIGKDDMVILFAGMNYGRKGLASLLKAASATRNGRNCRILVVGKGDGLRYQGMIRKLGLSERVVFCGLQSDMPSYYGAADAFVLPTYYDPCANVCLEAMACGLPVITTKENGASEWIENGVTGFVMDHPKDVTRLAEWLDALGDPETSRSMGMKAEQKVQGLTIGKNALQTLAVYHKVLREKSGAR